MKMVVVLVNLNQVKHTCAKVYNKNLKYKIVLDMVIVVEYVSQHIYQLWLLMLLLYLICRSALVAYATTIFDLFNINPIDDNCCRVCIPTHRSALVAYATTIFDLFNINPIDYICLKSTGEN